MDTTRADRIGCYGGSAAETPRLDALASEGVLFEDATSAASTTLSSHTSLMTGLYPRRHGVARNGFMVHPDNVTLAEVLGENGFHTAGVIGSFALDQVFDFDQGFLHWDQDFDIEFDPRTADQNQRVAERVTDAALAHVGRLDPAGRLFLFVHYFDVHSPYAPPEPYAGEYAVSGGKRASTLGDIGKQAARHQKRVFGGTRPIYDVGLHRPLVEQVDGAAIGGDDELAALYDGELAYTDREIGRLLDGLDEGGFLEDCIVVLTADHGETFWEHGDFWHHGAWVYQTNVHVPFLLRLPDGRGRGRRVSAPVSGVDVFPTLLDLLGIPLPEPVSGVSLLPLVDGEPLPERLLIAEATQPTKFLLNGQNIEERFGWPNQAKAKSARLGRWKLIQAPYLRYEELYDLEADPEERNNLLANPPWKAEPGVRASLREEDAEVARVLGELRRGMSEWIGATSPRPSAFNPEQLDEVVRRLQQLGYVGDEPEEEATDGQ